MLRVNKSEVFADYYLPDEYIHVAYNLIKFDKSVKKCMLMGSTRHPNGEYRSYQFQRIKL